MNMIIHDNNNLIKNDDREIETNFITRYLYSLKSKSLYN